ncbi:hypothetical protein NIES22_64050 [Calothrix brevissima NIES-22]|nr:hypothetical protein NIES22_64050 [Calothrix brevissima NIES-22]
MLSYFMAGCEIRHNSQHFDKLSAAQSTVNTTSNFNIIADEKCPYQIQKPGQG